MKAAKAYKSIWDQAKNEDKDLFFQSHEKKVRNLNKKLKEIERLAEEQTKAQLKPEQKEKLKSKEEVIQKQVIEEVASLWIEIFNEINKPKQTKMKRTSRQIQIHLLSYLQKHQTIKYKYTPIITKQFYQRPVNQIRSRSRDNNGQNFLQSVHCHHEFQKTEQIPIQFEVQNIVLKQTPIQQFSEEVVLKQETIQVTETVKVQETKQVHEESIKKIQEEAIMNSDIVKQSQEQKQKTKMKEVIKRNEIPPQLEEMKVNFKKQEEGVEDDGFITVETRYQGKQNQKLQGGQRGGGKGRGSYHKNRGGNKQNDHDQPRTKGSKRAKEAKGMERAS